MSFWKGKRVLVTGGSGFVGGHLVGYVRQKGATVIALGHQRVSVLGNLGSECEHIVQDISDKGQVTRIMAAYRVDLVYHLAAQAIGSVAQQCPVATLETNVQGTWNILESCRMLGVPAIIASSDKAYGSSPPPYTEETPLSPAGIYETSKACVDMIARSYYLTYKLPVAITRCANIYGGWDRNFTRIVPYTISQVLRGEPVEIWGDGLSKRDYIYIDDVVNAYVMLAEALMQGKFSGEVFNFGTGVATSVLDLVAMVNRIVGVDIPPNIHHKETGEIKEQWLNSYKAERFLGWKPKFSLEKGLRRTVGWYKEYLGFA